MSLDQDLIDHACNQLAKAARRHVSTGMGPASAARTAIRETKALFPPDWQLAVQGDDSDDEVEVWEVEHKRSIPCARISREAETASEPTTRLKANEIRARLKARGYQVKASGRADIRGPWEAWAVHRDLPILNTSGHASQLDALRALFDKAER